MIFYFSATGNSKNVADIIAECTGEKTVAIADVVRASGSKPGTDERTAVVDERGADCVLDSAFAYDLEPGERVGIVTPTYFWGLPLPTEEFLRRLRLTCGGRAAFWRRRVRLLRADLRYHAGAGRPLCR